jgi:alpha-tubulin suppressor-like RCC1 family protein
LSATRARALASLAAAVVGAGAALAGCLPTHEFHCERHAQCGASAFCEADGRCSAFDAKCPSGRRYLDDEGAVSNACVGDTCAPNPVVGVAAGVEHACAWRRDHSVSCWGRNDDGQLGDTTHTPRSRDVAVVGFPGAISVAAGQRHTCAATEGGAVFCWGADDAGQLGDGGGMARSTPVSVAGISTAVAVTAGEAFSCAILADRTAVCWGDNSLGQVGDGGTAGPNRRPAPVFGLKGIRSISAGWQHACAVRQDDTLWCWGDNTAGQLGDRSITRRPQPAQAQVPGEVTLVAAGLLHTCAATREDGLFCWGDNGAGQLGSEVTGAQTAPLPVRLVSDPIAVAAGSSHTCAIRQGGATLCWGANQDGQLGEGSTSALPIPAPVAELGAMTDVVAGGTFSCALDAHGALFCWGDDHFGELGLGRTVTRSAPAPVAGVSDAVDVAAGAGHTCVVSKPAGGTRSVSCWGANQAGQLGDATSVDRASAAPVKGDLEATRVTTGMAHTCVLTDGGGVLCWGRGLKGQLGPGRQLDTTTPIEVPLQKAATSVAAGDAHTCAALVDGTAQCWGANDDGQLGDGTTIDRAVPQAVAAAAGTTDTMLTAVDAVAAGGGHTCAHLTDGTLRCWGRNADGQLGDGDETASALPVDVTFGAKLRVTATSITAGEAHTCALDGSGSAWCWGANADGRLGNDAFGPGDATMPIMTIGVADARDLSAGGAHTCMVSGDGRVFCAGSNDQGQLGLAPGSVGANSIPLAGIMNVTRIATGAAHTCAIRDDGTVWCWGANTSGQLGDGDTLAQTKPQLTPLTCLPPL